MARSPSAPEPESSSESKGIGDAYRSGWAAINRLVRRDWSWSGHERDVAFLNISQDSVRFADVSYVTGLDDAGDGRALARIDWDFDGDQDLVRCSRTGPRLRLFRNGLGEDAPQGSEASEDAAAHWLAVKLFGAAPNTGAIGAEVELVFAGEPDDGDERFVQTRRAGDGYLAQSSSWLHFGLGQRRPQQIQVRWPDGSSESFQAEHDRFLLLRQGTGQAERFDPPPPVSLSPGALMAGSSPQSGRMVTSAPWPVPSLELRSEGKSRAILGVTVGGRPEPARPLLLSLFSRTCAPCARELAGLAQAADELDRAQLSVLALSVDPEEESEEVATFVQRTGFAGPLAHAPASTLEILDALAGMLRDSSRRLALPASFLFDGEGRLQVVYTRAVEAQEVIADMELFALEPEPRRRAALPFAGRFLRRAPVADIERLAQGLEKRALEAAAEQLRSARVQTRQVGQVELEVEFGKTLLGQGSFEQAAGHFRAALALDSEAVDAWKGLGYCQHRLQDRGAAREAYERALELDPEDDRNRANLALVLIELGDKQAAQDQLEELIARGSAYAETVSERLR